jgi:hypothetical protein
MRRCDVLDEVLPGEIPVGDARNPRNGAVAAVWLTVKVPPDAPAGEYEGRLAVSAQGANPVEVPVSLKVSAWRLPEPRDFVTYAGFVQSPETVALMYKVPLWSDRHFELIGKSLDRLAQVGNKVAYVPLICQTNFGNAESMVRWIRKAGGAWTVWC